LTGRDSPEACSRARGLLRQPILGRPACKFIQGLSRFRGRCLFQHSHGPESPQFTARASHSGRGDSSRRDAGMVAPLKENQSEPHTEQSGVSGQPCPLNDPIQVRGLGSGDRLLRSAPCAAL